MAWTDRTAAGGNQDDIFVRVFESDGTSSQANEVVVNTQTNLDQTLPAITALQDGGFAVAWLDGQNFNGASSLPVRARVFDEDGDPVSATDFLVNETPEGGGQFDPVITTLTDGRFVVCWRDVSFGNYRGQVFNADGSPSGGEFAVSSSMESNYAITALSGNRFAVAWDDGEDVVICIRNADGAAVTGEVTLTGVGVQNFPAVAALSDGRLVVVWQVPSDGSSGGIIARVFNADLTPSSDEFLVNATTLGTQTDPSVAALLDGSFVVTWEDQGDVRHQVFGVGRNVDGGEQADVLAGNRFDDSLSGFGGADSLSGGLGQDTLEGGAGNDNIVGNQDNDSINGGAGDDYAHGGAGSDTLIGEDGNDRLDGGVGADTINGGTGSDIIIANQDNDLLIGGAEGDYMHGGQNNDTLQGGAGNDVLLGGVGSDSIDGGTGHDGAAWSGLRSAYTVTNNGGGSW
ncbi:MAG: calcium-binding protein, partial [Hyphomicrobiaceae bacterium]